MWRKSFIVALVFAFGTIPLYPASAWISDWEMCEQQDLEGNWDAEVWAGDSSGNQFWDQCTLTVGPDGLIHAEGTYNNHIGESSDVTGGQLTINAECVIEGYIETSGGTVYVQHGAVDSDRLLLGVPE